MILENLEKLKKKLIYYWTFFNFIDEFLIFIAIFCIKAVKMCIIFYIVLSNSTLCERWRIKTLLLLIVDKSCNKSMKHGFISISVIWVPI